MDIAILKKEVGPFPVGVWLIIAGGGIVLAIVIRRSISSGGNSDNETNEKGVIRVLPEQSVSYPEVGNYLTPDQKENAGEKETPKGPTPKGSKPSGPGGGIPLPPAQPPIAPKPPQPPTTQPKSTIPTITSVTPIIQTGGKPVVITGTNLGRITRVDFAKYKSTAITHQGDGKMTVVVPPTAKSGSVVGIYTGGQTNGFVQLTVIPPPKSGVPPPTTPQPVVNVPGGYTQNCTGVLAPPADHPGANVVAWIHSSNNPSQRAGKALSWAIGGQTTVFTPSKLQAMKTALSVPGNWALINEQRRRRGLQPLNSSQFEALRTAVNTEAKSGRDAFPDSFVEMLWNTYHMPFLCQQSASGNAVPRALGVKRKL